MGAGLTSNLPQFYHAQKILIYADNTNVSGNTKNGNWVDLASYSINASQANYPQITVQVMSFTMIYVATGGATVQTDLRVYSTASTAQVGNAASTIYTNGDLDLTTRKQNYHYISAVLTAGTDYTRGTAFTIKLQGRVTNDAKVTDQSYATNGIIIEAVSD